MVPRASRPCDERGEREEASDEEKDGEKGRRRNKGNVMEENKT